MISYTRKPSAPIRIQCKNGFILLSVLWTFGLACGLIFVSLLDGFLFELFIDASKICPSILGILIVTFLPVAFSAIAVYCSVPSLIYALCIFKAFCFSFGLFGVAAVFGYSGWLIRMFLLFSDSCMAILLFWLWCRILSPKHDTIHRDLLICSAIAAVVGMVDYFLVSPYLAILMNYS